jgi:hypothetical protein
MRWQSKIIEIPSGSTREQIETALDTATKQGWQLVQIVQIGTKVYAIMKKLISA